MADQSELWTWGAEADGGRGAVRRAASGRGDRELPGTHRRGRAAGRGLTCAASTTTPAAAADDVDRRRRGRRGPWARSPACRSRSRTTSGRGGDARTCASRILEGFVPPYDATVVERLRAAGAVAVRQDQHRRVRDGLVDRELGVRADAQSLGPRRACPAARAAARRRRSRPASCRCALGSDTGGSIRQPAALCGVVGLKPTYGRVSRYGLVAFASSLDQIGPFARSTSRRGAAARGDRRARPARRTSLAAAGARLPRARSTAASTGCASASPREYFGEGIDAEVEARAASAALERLRGAGREIVEVSLPHTEYAIAAYYIIATAEASRTWPASTASATASARRRRDDLREHVRPTPRARASAPR